MESGKGIFKEREVNRTKERGLGVGTMKVKEVHLEEIEVCDTRCSGERSWLFIIYDNG